MCQAPTPHPPGLPGSLRPWAEARRYGARMIELVGDSSRDGEWALVRLRVDGETIVEADAPGLSRNLEGLTLLEAAAVPGETLAADALANAIGPVVRAGRGPRSRRRGDERRGRQRRRAAARRPWSRRRDAQALARPGGSERRACVLLARRGHRGPRGLPRAWTLLTSRSTSGRSSGARSSSPFVRGYERGETPNPCIACNGSFRFAELLAFAERVGAARLATGHYARIVSHRGRLLLARAVDREKDQSYMLGRLDPAFLDRIWFPLGEQTKAATRAEAEAAGLAAARTRREPGGLLPRRRRLPLLPRAARAERRRPDRRRGRARARQARRGVALHARPAPRAGRLVARLRSTRSGPMRRPRRSSSGPGSRSPRRASRPAGGCSSTWNGSRRSCATALPRSPREWSPRIVASASSSTSRPSRWRPGRPLSCTKATLWSGQG